jgi:hypothetical protein
MSETMKNVLTVIFLVLLVVLVIVGLLRLTRGSGPHSRDGSLRVERIVVDGKQITCVVYQGYRKGGLSCDWRE